MTKKKMGAKKISSTKKKKTVRYIVSYLKNLKKKKVRLDIRNNTLILMSIASGICSIFTIRCFLKEAGKYPLKTNFNTLSGSGFFSFLDNPLNHF